MKAYLDLLKHVMEHGNDRTDRTGVGTRGVFGYQFRHDMFDGFPLLTTKKVHTKSIIHELLWFLKGSTNVHYLQQNGVTIWNEWADKDGELGPVYGKQWRRWEGLGDFCTPQDAADADGSRDIIEVDQVTKLINDLKTNPLSRRHIVSAWNPTDVPRMKLPPCHTLWQCYVEESDETCRWLHLHLYARSIDSFLGLPFNIASYAFLLHMLAHVTDMFPGELVISFGDLHIYKNHFDQVNEQLSREPRKLPELRFARDVESIDDFRFEDFIIEGYDPLPSIKAPIAV